uniref:Lipocalin n=1 Tax=Rhipicephalus zambeziensis TaxID=60191 RepID=A0A224YCD8_9ACAR
MKFLVFILLASLLYAESSDNQSQQPVTSAFPDWANESLFGRYQNAWAAINETNVTYYMVMATHNVDTYFGQNFTCVRVKTTSVYSNDTVQAELKFRNATNNTITFMSNTTAVTRYNYTIPNAIQFGAQGNSTEMGVFVYSYPQQCDLLSVRNGTDLQLWVHENFTEQVPMCCQFLYDYFRPKK